MITLEGIGTEAQPHPLQRAFIEEQAVQCGYCINGMIMQSKALLDATRSRPRRRSARHWPNNLCRCGTHVRIVRAVQKAAASSK